MKKMRIEFSATKEIIEVANIDTGKILCQVPTSIFLSAHHMQNSIALYLMRGLVSMAEKEILNEEPTI